MPTKGREIADSMRDTKGMGEKIQNCADVLYGNHISSLSSLSLLSSPQLFCSTYAATPSTS